MARNDFLVGGPIALDADSLLQYKGFEESGITTSGWMKIHLDKMDLEYMTECEAILEAQADGSAESTHGFPGRYVYAIRGATGAESAPVAQLVAWAERQDVKRSRWDSLWAT